MKERPVDGLDPIAEGCRRLEAGAPPPRVDVAVRAAARHAARRRRVSAWTLPAALAATVLVALSIVVQVHRQETLPARDEAATAAAEPAGAPMLREAAPVAPPSAPGPVASDSAEAVAPRAAAAVAVPQALQPAAREAESPRDWLARIEALEAAGRREEAEAERRRLEIAHPGWLAEHAAQRD